MLVLSFGYLPNQVGLPVRILLPKTLGLKAIYSFGENSPGECKK